jgi:hypothetical protein
MDRLASPYDNDAVSNAFLVAFDTKLSTEGANANLAGCEGNSGTVFTSQILLTFGVYKGA